MKFKIYLLTGYLGNVSVWTSDGVISFLAKAILYTIMYVLLIYRYAMTDVEKEKIINVLRRFHR